MEAVRPSLLAQVSLPDRLDTWRAAKALVDCYGLDAAIHAAQRIDELAEAGDHEGQGDWVLILAAVDDLQRTERRSGEPQH